MKNNKYSTLVHCLVDSTVENRIRWQRTSRQNEYTTEVLNYSVAITSLSQGTFSIVKSQSEKYALTLFNEDSDLIDIIEVLLNDSDYEVMERLFCEARRSYYKVDEVLDGLIDTLK